MGGLFDGHIGNSLDLLQRKSSKRQKEGFAETGPDVEWENWLNHNPCRQLLLYDRAFRSVEGLAKREAARQPTVQLCTPHSLHYDTRHL
jgi:hypothetical protein